MFVLCFKKEMKIWHNKIIRIFEKIKILKIKIKLVKIK